MYTMACAQSTVLLHRPCCFVMGDGKAPADWKQSFIVCLYKEKGDALDRGNYRGLKLTEQYIKAIVRIAYNLIRQVVTIN